MCFMYTNQETRSLREGEKISKADKDTQEKKTYVLDTVIHKSRLFCYRKLLPDVVGHVVGVWGFRE